MPVICDIGNREKVQPTAETEATEIREVRASTLPRRRGDDAATRDCPRASTPSLDSAVGSAEGLGAVPGTEELRPRSDGSDSLVTSSALTSPEPQGTEALDSKGDAAQADGNERLEELLPESVVLRGWCFYGGD